MTARTTSGNKITFNFCLTCSAIVHYTLDGREELIAVPVGACADSHFPAPAFSVYEQHQHSWVTLPTNIEHSA